MESFYPWPGNPGLSIFTLWLASVVFLWAARAPMVQVLRGLARSLEHPQVITPGQDAPRPSEDPVCRTGQPCGDRLHPAPESVLSSRFHDQVRMIAL